MLRNSGETFFSSVRWVDVGKGHVGFFPRGTRSVLFFIWILLHEFTLKYFIKWNICVLLTFIYMCYNLHLKKIRSIKSRMLNKTTLPLAFMTLHFCIFLIFLTASSQHPPGGSTFPQVLILIKTFTYVCFRNCPW